MTAPFGIKTSVRMFDIDAMLVSGIGPVNLETNIRFLADLRAATTWTSCANCASRRARPTSRIMNFRKPDGVLAAEVKNVMALLDLSARRLMPNPEAHWRARARSPEKLGLSLA
ncbi:acyl-CoA thioester hydrolase [Sphingomonas sp. UYAg733]